MKCTAGAEALGMASHRQVATEDRSKSEAVCEDPTLLLFRGGRLTMKKEKNIANTKSGFSLSRKRGQAVIRRTGLRMPGRNFDPTKNSNYRQKKHELLLIQICKQQFKCITTHLKLKTVVSQLHRIFAFFYVLFRFNA